MKKLFDKNEVTFAVVLIVVYVVGSGMMQGISESLHVEYLAEMVFNIVMSAVLFLFIQKHSLMEHVGLCRPEVSAARMWFYLPLLLGAALPVVYGLGAQYPAPALACRTVCMLFVGFLEEIIFRGFLFKGICRSNVTRAIVISAVTFGIGHIVNLLSGAAGMDTIVQIVFAVCVGFMLVFVFHRTGSLLLCIGFHSLNNCLTGFTSDQALIDAVGSEETAMILGLAIRLLIMVVYTVYMIRMLPEREQTA